MNNFLLKFAPEDLIAIICIVGGFILMALHIDGVVAGIVVMVASFYFGSKIRIKSPNENE